MPGERLADSACTRIVRIIDEQDLAWTLYTYAMRFVVEAEAARLAALRRSRHDLEVIEKRLAALPDMQPKGKQAYGRRDVLPVK